MNKKLAELNDEELKEVAGDDGEALFSDIYFKWIELLAGM